MNAFAKISDVTFPAPKDIMINMMPFIIGDKNSIPEEYRHYYSLIEKCEVPEEEGKIGYISISESIVKPNNSQRRGGIHTEKHPESSWGGSAGGWGGGHKSGSGLFMASTVENSCQMWNVNIETPGLMGDCEHLRDSLGQGTFMKKGELFWLTDSCPHESRPLEKETYRQWFRFVTSNVDVWYKKHSTANRLGIQPSCKIIEESKF